MLFFLTAQAVEPTNANGAGNLSEELYHRGADATGVRLCDRERARRYKEQFDLRFGARVRRLMQYHTGNFGPDPDLVVISSCRASTSSDREQDRYHARAMNHFEATLRELERRFGPGEDNH